MSGYVSELEQLGTKLIRIQVGELGLESKQFVVKLTNQTLLSAFKQGLEGEPRMVVLAANPKSFAAAIEIAMDAECSMQGAHDTGFINANDNRKKGGKKFYKNSQNTSYNYSQPPNSNDSREKYHQQQAWGPKKDNTPHGFSSGNRSQGSNNFNTQRVHMVNGQPTQESQAQNNVEFFRE